MNLSRILKKRTNPLNKVFVFIDWENLISNAMTTVSPQKFSFEEGLEKTIDQITKDVGPIVGVFVFAPPHLVSAWGDLFRKQEFFTIWCPKIKDKNNQERDSVDEELSRFTRKILAQHPEITHICLGSGDRDYLPLLTEIKQYGLEIIILAGNIQSLSSELIPYAEKGKSRRRVYFFSPEKKEN